MSPQGEPATSNRRSCVGAWRALMWLVSCSMLSNGCAFSKKGNRMPIIRANAGIITQINVFTVAAGGQQALIDLLSESA